MVNVEGDRCCLGVNPKLSVNFMLIKSDNTGIVAWQLVRVLTALRPSDTWLLNTALIQTFTHLERRGPVPVQHVGSFVVALFVVIRVNDLIAFTPVIIQLWVTSIVDHTRDSIPNGDSFYAGLESERCRSRSWLCGQIVGPELVRVLVVNSLQFCVLLSQTLLRCP